MKASKALRVLAGKEAGDRDKAANVLAVEVLKDSKFGDPDSSLTDWLYSGDYDGSETVTSITKEWDSDR